MSVVVFVLPSTERYLASLELIQPRGHVLVSASVRLLGFRDVGPLEVASLLVGSAVWAGGVCVRVVPVLMAEVVLQMSARAYVKVVVYVWFHHELRATNLEHRSFFIFI
jgi:hypothetical protein